MAKIQYTALVPDDTIFTSEYPQLSFASKEKESGFELHDPDGNYLNYVEVHGNGLKYRHGYLVGGTLTGVEYKDGDGDNYVTISHADYKVVDKFDLSSLMSAYPYLLEESGDDKITGSKESDVLYSHGGNDVMIGGKGDDTLVTGSNGHARMTGGQGSDTFVFENLTKAVITDFDANGGGKDQDYLYFENTNQITPRIYQDHHNTVLDFGHHLTVTLLDVDRADFSLVDDIKKPPVLDM